MPLPTCSITCAHLNLRYHRGCTGSPISHRDNLAPPSSTIIPAPAAAGVKPFTTATMLQTPSQLVLIQPAVLTSHAYLSPLCSHGQLRCSQPTLRPTAAAPTHIGVGSFWPRASSAVSIASSSCHNPNKNSPKGPRLPTFLGGSWNPTVPVATAR